jgi:hypothetical protein
MIRADRSTICPPDGVFAKDRATGQAALRQVPVEVADILEDRQHQFERVRSILIRLGYRSVLSIPLLLVKDSA